MKQLTIPALLVRLSGRGRLDDCRGRRAGTRVVGGARAPGSARLVGAARGGGGPADGLALAGHTPVGLAPFPHARDLRHGCWEHADHRHAYGSDRT